MRIIYDDVSQWTYRQFVEGTDDWRLDADNNRNGHFKSILNSQNP